MAVVLVTTTMAGAINYTHVTDTSADWASVPNSTYFYDKADKLVHYKDGTGSILEIFSSAGGGLTYFTEAQNSSAPNATVNVDSLTAIASTTDADVSIVPKGNGAFQLDIPDDLTTGGNKRGTNAIDLQIARTNATHVASGSYAVAIGYTNRASNTSSTAIGYLNTASAIGSVAIGYGNTSSGNYTTTLGTSNTANTQNATAIGGSGNTASGAYSFTTGLNNLSSGTQSVTMGALNTAVNTASIAIGYQNTVNSGYAIAMGYLCTASGQSSVSLGQTNATTSTGSIALGVGNTATGYVTVAMGSANVTSADNQVAIGTTNTFTGASVRAMAFGNYNELNSQQSMVFGNFGLTNGIFARQVFSANRFTVNGDSQKSIFFLNVRTTDTSTKYLTTNALGTQNALNIINLSNNSLYRYKGQIIAKQSGSTNVAAWDIDGLIVRGVSASTTVLLINNLNLVQNTPAWTTPIVSAVIDAFNGVGGLSIQVNGNAATNIQWNCIIETTELIYQ